MAADDRYARAALARIWPIGKSLAYLDAPARGRTGEPAKSDDERGGPYPYRAPSPHRRVAERRRPELRNRQRTALVPGPRVRPQERRDRQQREGEHAQDPASQPRAHGIPLLHLGAYPAKIHGPDCVAKRRLTHASTSISGCRWHSAGPIPLRVVVPFHRHAACGDGVPRMRHRGRRRPLRIVSVRR